MHKLRSIQVLRGIAATAVVVHHAYRFVDPHSFARVGAAGVDVFFVISGFIMATVGPKRTPGQFIVDRLWRIFPIWLIAVSPWLIAIPHNWQTIATSLTLWPIWGGTYHTPALLLGWTLCFEMLFYAAFTVALVTRFYVPIAAYLICLALGPRTPLLDYLGSPMIFEFLAGVCIARLPLNRWMGAPLILVAVAWFAIAPTNYYAEMYGIGAWLRLLSWGVPAAVIVYGARSLESAFGRKLFDIPVLVGSASYSVYLFQNLVVRPFVPWPVSILAAVSFGVAIFWFVERRILALKPNHTSTNERENRWRSSAPSEPVTDRLT